MSSDDRNSDDGPPLEVLLRRLTDCPQEFLEPPRIGTSGKVEVAAVVSDLLVDLGGVALTKAEALKLGLIVFNDKPIEKNRLSMILICSWLLSDPYFLKVAASQSRAESVRLTSRLRDFFLDGFQALAELVQAPLLVHDPERREELIRIVLKALAIIPAGESDIQSADRLMTVSSVERDKVMRQVQASEERARQVREAMKKKAAEEAAAAYGRE